MKSFILLFLTTLYAVSSADEASLASSWGEHWAQHTEAGVGKCLADPVVTVRPSLTLPDNLKTDAELTCGRTSFTLAYKKTARSIRVTMDAQEKTPCGQTFPSDPVWERITVPFSDCGVLMTASPHLLTYSHRVRIVDRLQGRGNFEQSQIINIDVHCDLVPATNSTPLVPNCCPEVTDLVEPPCQEVKFQIFNYKEKPHTNPSESGNIEFSIHPVDTGFSETGFYVDHCDIKNTYGSWISINTYIPVVNGAYSSAGAKVYKVNHPAPSSQYGYALSIVGWRTNEASVPAAILYKLFGYQIQCTVALCKNRVEDIGNAPLCKDFPRANPKMTVNSLEQRNDRSLKSGRVFGKVLVAK